jgi:hypothetical protein
MLYSWSVSTPSRIPDVRPAARRWLVRYLTEGTPSMRDVAKVTSSLAKYLALDDVVNLEDFRLGGEPDSYIGDDGH